MAAIRAATVATVCFAAATVILAGGGLLMFLLLLLLAVLPLLVFALLLAFRSSVPAGDGPPKYFSACSCVGIKPSAEKLLSKIWAAMAAKSGDAHDPLNAELKPLRTEP